ncbi:MAG: dTDP-4-dehydrorhamnose 3,5-epimerase [Candidatus Thorarchaeota archaeon]|nr:dTDP-4-dehydrorhamnose 3,5-epimerase [Candidatus Thorarchaeota archaeon]
MTNNQGVRIIKTKFKEAVLIEPVVHDDYRGYFKETFRKNLYHELGIDTEFVQDNVSWSYRNVIRGMHFDFNVAKLVQVVQGRTYHVIADMRESSETYKEWQSFILSDSNHRQLFVPAGFANGFLVLSDTALVHYKQGTYWNSETDQGFPWDDPSIGIKWPIENPILSEKDGMKFR